MLIAVGIFCIVAILILLPLIIWTILQVHHRKKMGQELVHLLKKNQCKFIVIDVRMLCDFQQNHVATARNIQYSELSSYYPSENMFERIIIFGPNHRKARLAAGVLGKNGYCNVTHFGAYPHWNGPAESSKTTRINEGFSL